MYDRGNRGEYRKKTVPVAALRAANAWGLRHMHGNVWEWTEDCWHGDYGGAPEDGSAWSSSGGGNCAYRVVRGGSWEGDPWLLRSADRDGVPPEIRDDILGFRPAKTLPTP